MSETDGFDSKAAAARLKFAEVVRDAAVAATEATAATAADSEKSTWVDEPWALRTAKFEYTTRRSYTLGTQIYPVGTAVVAWRNPQGNIVLQFEDGETLVCKNAFLAGIDGPSDRAQAPTLEIELWRAYQRKDRALLELAVTQASRFIERLDRELTTAAMSIDVGA